MSQLITGAPRSFPSSAQAAISASAWPSPRDSGRTKRSSRNTIRAPRRLDHFQQQAAKPTSSSPSSATSRKAWSSGSSMTLADHLVEARVGRVRLVEVAVGAEQREQVGDVLGGRRGERPCAESSRDDRPDRGGRRIPGGGRFSCACGGSSTRLRLLGLVLDLARDALAERVALVRVRPVGLLERLGVLLALRAALLGGVLELGREWSRPCRPARP